MDTKCDGCIDDDEKIVLRSKNILKRVRNEEDIRAESALLTYVRIRCRRLNLILFYRQEQDKNESFVNSGLVISVLGYEPT